MRQERESDVRLRLGVPYPVTVLVAGVIWVILGSLLLLGLAAAVVVAVLAGGGLGRPATWPLAACGLGMVGLLGMIFLNFGVQCVRGTSSGVGSNGAASIVFGLLVLVPAAAIDWRELPFAGAAQSLIALALTAGGVLALVGRHQYQRWRLVMRPGAASDRPERGGDWDLQQRSHDGDEGYTSETPREGAEERYTGGRSPETTPGPKREDP
jgi:hypothetical protein